MRLATTADSEAIRAIYNREVLESTVTFDLVPRSAQDQLRWLQDRSGAHAVVVAVDDDGTVAGFASLSPYKDRAAYRTTVESSIYLHQDFQGRGLGKLLLGELLELAVAHGFHSAIARVVGGHAASIGLHRALGYELVGTEREVGRKFGRWLDVVVLQRML